MKKNISYMYIPIVLPYLASESKDYDRLPKAFPASVKGSDFFLQSIRYEIPHAVYDIATLYKRYSNSEYNGSTVWNDSCILLNDHEVKNVFSNKAEGLVEAAVKG